MLTWKNWNAYFFSDGDECNSIYAFPKNIVTKPFAKDICEDTMCTNYFGLPLVITLSVDENMRNQNLVSYQEKQWKASRGTLLT